MTPISNAGIEKIVKAALALRNRNGGYFAIGFDDSTLLPDVGHEPANIRDAFHLDKIQGYVSRYSSELFEIGVGFSQRDGIDHPVIAVPSGVRTPVATKRTLIDGTKTLIRHGAIYFRTLAANGTPSTAEARPEDWREIVEICFDNREADVGRFLRRQLGGADSAALMTALREIGFAGTNSPPPPTLRDNALAFLEDGERRFQAALQARTLDAAGQRLVDAGSWSIALVIEPSHTDARPDRTFASTIAASNPKLTGWPVWLDSSASANSENRPIVRDHALESLIISVSPGWSNHLDFSRLDPKGEFYLRRILQDDAVDRVTPGTVFDPLLMILRVAEAIAVGISFARALGWDSEKLALASHFDGQSCLVATSNSWANPEVSVGPGTAHDDTVTTFVELSLDTPLSAIAPFVEQATLDLFVVFDGHSVPSRSVEEWVRRLVERRL